jgi:hypothetical protein
MLVRAFFLWLLMSVLAVANGVIRTLWITPHLGEATAHILGTLSALILLFGAIVLILPWVGPRNKNQVWIIGGFWLVLTLAFEFLAGHYLFGNPWERLLADYNIFRGRVWVTVLLLQLFGPFFAAKIRGLLPKEVGRFPGER